MISLEPSGLRERKRVQTRRTIARVALELFDRQGFRDTTIPQIAEAADVSPRTVSAYFPHKEDLAFPDSEAATQSLEDRLRDRRAGESTTEALRDWLRSWLEENREHLAEREVQRRVVRADEGLRAYAHRHTLRAQRAIVEAIARDLGVSADALEPRMAAAATITVFELLGEDYAAAGSGKGGDPATEPLALLDRALLFIGGGVRALGGGD